MVNIARTTSSFSSSFSSASSFASTLSSLLSGRRTRKLEAAVSMDMDLQTRMKDNYKLQSSRYLPASPSPFAVQVNYTILFVERDRDGGVYQGIASALKASVASGAFSTYLSDFSKQLLSERGDQGINIPNPFLNVTTQKIEITSANLNLHSTSYPTGTATIPPQPKGLGPRSYFLFQVLVGGITGCFILSCCFSFYYCLLLRKKHRASRRLAEWDRYHTGLGKLEPDDPIAKKMNKTATHAPKRGFFSYLFSRDDQKVSSAPPPTTTTTTTSPPESHSLALAVTVLQGGTKLNDTVGANDESEKTNDSDKAEIIHNPMIASNQTYNLYGSAIDVTSTYNNDFEAADITK